MNDQSNGNGLPENRKAIADAAATAFQIEYQTVAARRDELQAENLALKSDLAIQKELYDIATSQINDMKSRVESMTVTRDDAVRLCAERDTVLEAINSLLRTFQVKNMPVIKDTTPT